MFKGIIGLHPQFFSVTEEQCPLGPTSAQQQLSQRDGYASFTCAGGLDNERFATLALKVRCDRFDGFNLLRAISNAEFWIELFELCRAIMALINQVIQTVFTV